MHTFYMVHGKGEFFNTVIALFPGETEANEHAAQFPDVWQVSEVQLEVPFTLLQQVPFTPSN